MPNYFPEGDSALPTDSIERSAAKVVSQLPAALDKWGIDPDAAAYAELSGATDIAALSAFVKGVKELGLWNNMVCWPLRSSQNAGTGTTAYSLGGLGTFNGTLVNGPAWGANGITYDGVNDKITTSLTLGATQVFCGVVGDMPTGATQKGNFLAGANSNVQTIYWTNPRTSFGGEYRYGGSYLSVGDNTTSGVHMWSSIGGVGFSTKGYRSTTLLGTAGGAVAAEPNPIGLNAGLVLGRNDGGYGGTAAFAFIIHATPSSPDAFYALYKSTLGTGLSLP